MYFVIVNFFQRQGLLAEALGDENDLTLEDDVDNDFKTDVLLERKSLYKRDTSSVDTEFEMGNLDDETELSPEVIASDKVTSLSVQRLWNVLISAGKRVATWAKKNDKEQGFLSGKKQYNDVQVYRVPYILG